MRLKPVLLILGFSFLISLVFGTYLTYLQQKADFTHSLAIANKAIKPQVLGMSGGGGGSRSNRPAQMYVYGGENAMGSGGVISMSSLDDPTLSISSYNIQGEAKLSIYKSSLDAVLKYLTHDSENKQLNKNVDTSSLELLGSTTHNIVSSDNGTLLPLPIEGKGIWYVTLEVGGIKVDGYIIRSDNGLVSKEGDNKFVFWGQNFNTKRSVSGGDLKLYNLKDNVAEIASAQFDQSGMAEAGISAEADLAILQSGDDISLLPLNLQYLNVGYGYTTFTEPIARTRYFLFTDRPLYQPGDTVNFKAILRRDDDARYSLPSGEAKVTIQTGNNETKFEKSYPISEEGSVNGKYELPKDAPVGGYNLTIDTGNKIDYAWGEYSSNSLYFNVENYQNPESFINVDTENLEYISGDTAKVTISGSYFSGQPLLATDIKYKITALDYYEYSYFSDQERWAKLGFNTFYGVWYGSEIIKEGVVTLDESGQASVEVYTKQLENPGEYSSYTKGKSKIFVVEATHEDGSLTPAFSKKNFIVYAGDYGIYQTNYQGSGKVNDVYKLPLKLSPYFRQVSLSGVKLTGKIHRETWVKDDVQTQKYPTYHKEEEDLGNVDLTTDKSAGATLSFTPTKLGLYKLTIEGRDKQDNYIAKDFNAYISAYDQPIYRGMEAPGLSITLDKDRYQPTDTAVVTIVSDIPDRDLFLTLERGRLDRSQIVHLSGKNATVELPLKDTDIPNMYLTISSFNNYGLDMAETNLPVSPEGKKLDVTITPDNEKYGPGDNINVTVTTVDSDGNPKSAEVALWAVDKAIFELADTNLSNIFNTFWSERSDTTSETHSLMGILTQQAEGGGGGDGPRSTFKDTAYWNPSIKTGSDGKASIKFKLPDNLTTWTLAAVGSTKDTKVGQATYEIKVSKDLIVRPILPNIMRIGDEIYLSALVQNFTGKDHEFQVQLTFDSGDVKENTWEKVKIGSMAVENLSWQITPNKITDAAKLKITASAYDDNSVTDSIEVTLPVRQFGFLEKTGETGIGTVSYTPKLDSQIDQSLSSVKLSLAPSLFGTLPTVMNYLVDYAYGCVEQTVSRLVPAILVAENPSLFGESTKDKNLDKIVDKSLARLAKMQRGDGGWTWWYTGKSDPYITTYAVEYITKAAKLGYQIPSNMLSNATRYLQNNPLDFSSSDPDLLALSIITNPSSKDLNKLTSLAVSQGDALYWEAGTKARFGSIEASTGMALQAMIAAGADKNLIDKAALYLTRSRKSDYWSNTYATSRIISALIDYAKLSRDLTPNYKYTVTQDGKELSSASVTDARSVIKDIEIPLNKLKGNSNLAINQEGEGNLYSTLLISQFLTSTNLKSVSRGISITKRFENVKGAELPIGVGDTVNVLLTVSGLSSEDKYGVIADELPSGMVPVNTSLKNEQSSWNIPDDYETSFNITDTDVTENGVVLSLYNVPSGEHTYSYKARVVSAGKFSVPPAIISLMYAPEIYARSNTSQIELQRDSGSKTGQLTNKFIWPVKIGAIVGAVVIIVSIIYLVVKKRRTKLLVPPPLPPNEI